MLCSIGLLDLLVRIFVHMTKEYVLVIDDSITNQVLIEALLLEEGIRVHTVGSSAEALAYMKKEKPSLILLDILMPNVTGIDFLKSIKMNSETKHIPVFIITAANTEAYREQSQSLGATEFLPKPIDINYFIKRVKKVLHNDY